MSFTLRVDERLALRLVEPHHAGEIFAVVESNRDRLAQWLPWVPLSGSVDDVRGFAERSLREFAERKQLAVSILEDGKVVGGTGWTDWRQGDALGVRWGSADIGYWLAESAQGRGVMTRCVRALLDEAFGRRGIQRVTIRAEPANERSCAVPRRLGFAHEGTLRHVCRYRDRWVDHHLFAMLADQWRGLSDRTASKQGGRAPEVCEGTP